MSSSKVIPFSRLGAVAPDTRRTKRILVAADLRANKRGSLEDQFISLAKKLGSAGAPIDFAFSQEAIPEVKGPITATGADVFSISFRERRQAAFQMYRLVRSRRYQLVHFHFQRSYEPVVLAARLAGARVILSEHMVLHTRPDDGTFTSTLRTRATQTARSHLGGAAALRLAVSQAVATSLQLVESVPSSKIAIVRNAVDLDRFRLAPATNRSAVRQELGVSGPFILCISRLCHEKGVDVLIRAIAGSPRDSALRQSTCVIAGDGHDRATLESLAHQLGIAAQLRFLGVRNDIERLYAAADVVAMPSRCAESCSLVVLEAQAAGRPVVASSVGGVPEHLQDGVGGLLVPPDDPRALMTALERLLLDPELARRLGDQGSRQVAARFTLERWANELAAIYVRQVRQLFASAIAPS